jgi:hypothetical protein
MRDSRCSFLHQQVHTCRTILKAGQCQTRGRHSPAGETAAEANSEAQALGVEGRPYSRAIREGVLPARSGGCVRGTPVFRLTAAATDTQTSTPPALPAAGQWATIDACEGSAQDAQRQVWVNGVRQSGWLLGQSSARISGAHVAGGYSAYPWWQLGYSAYPW